MSNGNDKYGKYSLGFDDINIDKPQKKKPRKKYDLGLVEITIEPEIRQEAVVTEEKPIDKTQRKVGEVKKKTPLDEALEILGISGEYTETLKRLVEPEVYAKQYKDPEFLKEEIRKLGTLEKPFFTNITAEPILNTIQHVGSVWEKVFNSDIDQLVKKGFSLELNRDLFEAVVITTFSPISTAFQYIDEIPFVGKQATDYAMRNLNMIGAVVENTVPNIKFSDNPKKQKEWEDFFIEVVPILVAMTEGKLIKDKISTRQIEKNPEILKETFAEVLENAQFDKVDGKPTILTGRDAVKKEIKTNKKVADEKIEKANTVEELQDALSEKQKLEKLEEKLEPKPDAEKIRKETKETEERLVKEEAERLRLRDTEKDRLEAEKEVTKPTTEKEEKVAKPIIEKEVKETKKPTEEIVKPEVPKEEVTTLYRGERRGIRQEGTDVPFTLDKRIAEIYAGEKGRVVAITLPNSEIINMRFSKLPDRQIVYYLPQEIYEKAKEFEKKVPKEEIVKPEVLKEEPKPVKEEPLYKALKDKEVYDIRELSKETKKHPREVSNTLKDLQKQGLIRKEEKGFVPTEEFKVLIEEVKQNPEKYRDENGKLYTNPVTAIVKGIGETQRVVDDLLSPITKRIYKGLSKTVSKLIPEKIKAQWIVNHGFPMEYVTLKRETRNAIDRYRELSEEIGNSLFYKEGKTKFTTAERQRFGQLVKTDISYEPITQSKVFKERSKRAINEIKQLETLGKELKVLPLETYNTKLPRKRINELLTERANLVKKFNKTKDKKVATKIKEIELKVHDSYIHGNEGYFKRIYSTKEQQKLLNKYGIRPTRLDLTSAIHRKDIPLEVRQKMGEVLEAAYPVSKGIMLEGRDVSLGRFFEAILEHPDWASETEVMGWTKMPKDKKLGKLSEKYVEPKIADDINDIIKLTSEKELDKFWRQGISIWKATKTILSPPTHSRNIMSNTILLDFSGVSHIAQVRIMPQAIETVFGRGKYGKEFKASRLSRATFKEGELGEYLNKVKEDKGFWKLDFPDKILKLYGKVTLVDTKLGKKLGDIYQFEETLSKATKFIHEREKGSSIKDATIEANKWLFDYGEVPPAVRNLRTNPLIGVPFMTWTYKAFPRIIESAITRPISFWKYPIIFSALAKYSLDKLDISEDEWNEIVSTLPDRMLKGEWLLLPFRDDNNKLQMLDLTYIVPYKDVYDVVMSGYTLVTTGKANSGDDIVEGALGLIQTPIFKSLAELMANKNTYNNQQIWSEVDSPKEKLQKALDYMYKQWMPSFAPEIPGISKGGYNYHKLSSVIQGKEDYYGRTFSLAPAVASAFLGLKTTPIELQRNVENRKFKLKRQIGELGTKRNRILRDGSIPKEERLKEAQKIADQQDELRKQIEDLKIPVRNEQVKDLEGEIRSYQKELGDTPLAQKDKRESLQTEINTRKIEINNILSKRDEGEIQYTEEPPKEPVKDITRINRVSLRGIKNKKGKSYYFKKESITWKSGRLNYFKIKNKLTELKKYNPNLNINEAINNIKELGIERINLE